MRARPTKAFTLVELVMVVLLISILAGLAVPRVVDSVQLAAEQAFISQMQVYVAAIERYYAVEGDPPGDSKTGNFPEDLEDYLREETWIEDTPIGGYWDVEAGDYGIKVAVGVDFDDGELPATEVLSRIDARVDDGDPNTGALRMIDSDRYYYVVD